MFKNTHTYMVCPKTRLDKIFANGLPVNSFIDKGRCAIGGTYSEITNTERSSLITVPNISILLSKEADHPEIKIVYGEASYQKVKLMLLERKPGIKIMTTPEGMKKIMDAATEIGCLDEVCNEWFLLLDEVHTFISESYRPDILRPFEYFWNFKYKSIISATPFIFTDPRFRTLDYHKIMFTEKLGTVRLFNSTSVVGTLDYILKHINEFPGNVHIFYNSVQEIIKAINRAKLSDCNIFCGNDKDGNNKRKLGDLFKFFVEQPSADNFKKINFYTCKYFEGWDLFDKDATAILVTDVYQPHTKVGVGSKGKQAIGRVRLDEKKNSNLFQIIHITNHTNNRTMQPLEKFREQYLEEAQFLIAKNNEHVALLKRQDREIEDDETLLRYADIDPSTKLATLNLMKLDQQINKAANEEIYNHIDYIQKDWEDAYFNVVKEEADCRLETGTQYKRKSAASQLKEDYLRLKTHKTKQQQGMVFSIGKSVEQDVKDTNPLAYKAYKLVEEAKMDELNYNVKKVQAEVIVKENKRADQQLLELLNNAFRVNNFYSNEQVKTKLQAIYTALNLREANGKVKVAKANEIAEAGRFEVAITKRQNDKTGNYDHGLVIIRPQFALRMVA
jgi:hypothetical protein